MRYDLFKWDDCLFETEDDVISGVTIRHRGTYYVESIVVAGRIRHPYVREGDIGIIVEIRSPRYCKFQDLFVCRFITSGGKKALGREHLIRVSEILPAEDARKLLGIPKGPITIRGGNDLVMWARKGLAVSIC